MYVAIFESKISTEKQNSSERYDCKRSMEYKNNLSIINNMLRNLNMKIGIRHQYSCVDFRSALELQPDCHELNVDKKVGNKFSRPTLYFISCGTY